MAITVGNGTLLRYYAHLDQGRVDAYIAVTFSNDTTREDSNVYSIPVSALQAAAQAAGRSDWTATDVCTLIAANIPGFSPNTITPATS